MEKVILTGVACLFVAAAILPPPNISELDISVESRSNSRRLFDAIREIEKPRLESHGDFGNCIGPYGMPHAVWADVLEKYPFLGGEYKDCRNAAYAERIIEHYWLRYVPDGTDEERIRVWAAGEGGMYSQTANDYWQAVNTAFGMK